MSKSRKTKAPYAGEHGKCSWCGTSDLPKGRISWCSQECVDEYLIRSSGEHIRKLVHERDQGICAICKCDCDKEYQAWIHSRREVDKLARRLIHMSRWHMEWKKGIWTPRNTDHPDPKKGREFIKELKKKYAPGRWTPGRVTGWDADHIIPVCEGGGECDLSNYRTLCHPCHKVVTAELAARRAEARRIQKRKEEGDLFSGKES